jgi:hypothetical protein
MVYQLLSTLASQRTRSRTPACDKAVSETDSVSGGIFDERPEVEAHGRRRDGAKPAAKEYEIHDALRDGLRLRVNPGGTKSWTLFYHRDGRNRRLGLGRYPWISLSRARERAAEALGRIKGPERADPAQESAVQRSAATFGELAALFLESQHFVTRADSTQKELRRILAVELLPEWASRRLSTIERQEIQRWGDRIVAQGRRYMANRCREYM